MDANVNTTQSPVSDPVQGAILVSITIPGIIGNVIALIIAVRILKLKEQQFSPNIFVFGLICIDLFAVLSLSIPSLIFYAAGEWVGGEILCRFQGFVALFCSLASGGIAVTMALDRYVSVSYPFAYRAKMRISLAKKIVISVVTGTAALSFLPVGGIGRFVKSLSRTFCTFDWFAKDLEDVVYSYGILVYSGVLIVTLVFCNVNVIIKLCRKCKRKTVLSVEGGHNSLSRRNNLEWQFGRMMVVISAIFLVCWIPFTVRVACNMARIWPSKDADRMASRLALLNFVLDPFTYVLTRTQYRHALRNMCCKKRSHRVQRPTSWCDRRRTRTSIILQDIGTIERNRTRITAANENSAKPQNSSCDDITEGVQVTMAMVRGSCSSDSFRTNSLTDTEFSITTTDGESPYSPIN